MYFLGFNSTRLGFLPIDTSNKNIADPVRLEESTVGHCTTEFFWTLSWEMIKPACCPYTPPPPPIKNP